MNLPTPPYAQIVSFDEADFPFQDVSSYAQCFLVDWRDEESRILTSFFRAVPGLASEGIRLEADEGSQFLRLVHGAQRLEIRWGDQVSAQHSLLAALQQVVGATHTLRYLNHAAFGDTAYLLVETNEAWRQLEEQNPHVRWFFTPIDRLPDIFATDVKKLTQAGAAYYSET